MLLAVGWVLLAALASLRPGLQRASGANPAPPIAASPLDSVGLQDQADAVADPTGPGSVLLPFALQFITSPDVRAAATARARTATALARDSSPTATPTATATASLTPSPTARPSTTASPISSASASAPPPTAPIGGSSTPISSPSGPTRPPSTASPTPTPDFAPRDIAADSLRPAAAYEPAETNIAWDPVQGVYRFTLGDVASDNVTLELETRHPDFRRGRLTLRHAESGHYPAAGGGLYFRTLDDELFEPRMFNPSWTVESVSHRLLDDGSGVAVSVFESLDGELHAKRYTVTPRGRSVELHLQSLDGSRPALGGYAGASPGAIEAHSAALALRIPLMEPVPLTLVDGRYFVSLLHDAPRSASNELQRIGPASVPGAFSNLVVALNMPDAIARVRAVDEYYWLTVTERIEDAFPVPPGPPSPWRASLAGRANIFAGDGSADGVQSFEGSAAAVATLGALGASDLVVHRDAWTDPAAYSPDHTGPDPALGGVDGLRALADTAGSLSLTAAYSLTVQGCSPGTTNPHYSASDRVTGADGLPKRMQKDQACAAGAPGAARYLLAPDSALARANTQADERLALGAHAADLRVQPAWNPGWPVPGAPDTSLDLAASALHPASTGDALRAIAAGLTLLQGRGPVFAAPGPGPAEQAYGAFHGGVLDGVWRSLSSPSDASAAGIDEPVVPDYALRMLLPRLMVLGAGPYEPFFGEPVDRLSEAQLDAYAARTVAFGSAVSWQLEETPTAGALFLYYALMPLQQRTMHVSDVQVEYFGPDGAPRDLSAALRAGLDMARPRIRLTYKAERPVEVYVNRSGNAWPLELRGTARILPPDGWLFDAVDAYGFSALEEGRRIDFVRTPDYVLLDGRGETTRIEGSTARDLLITFRDGSVIEEQPDGRLERRSAPVGAIHESVTLSQGTATIVRDIKYRSGPDAVARAHSMDLFLPASAPFPLVVFVHGGAWRSGDKNEVPGELYDNVGHALASRGIATALINYRLSVPHPEGAIHPDHARDVAAATGHALAWLIARGKRPSGIFLMGHDAGAHLAALITTNPRFLAEHDLEPRDIRGVIGLSGIYAIDPLGTSDATVFGLDPAGRLDASPMHHLAGAASNFRLLVAEDDLPGRWDQAREFDSALIEAGVSAEWFVVPARDHVGLVERFGDRSDPVMAAVLALVSSSVPTVTPEATSTATAAPSPTATGLPTDLPSPTPTTAEPPRQPARGPGGAERPYSTFQTATGPDWSAWWPGDAPLSGAPPAPQLPLLVCVPDAASAREPDSLAAWMAHVARGGHAVILAAPDPIAEPSDTGGAETLAAGAVASAVRAARAALLLRGQPTSSDRWNWCGIGTGAAVTEELAANSSEHGVRPPSTLLVVSPRRAGDRLPSERSLPAEGAVPGDALVVFIALEDDESADPFLAERLWSAARRVPGARKVHITLRSDRYGTPQLVADAVTPLAAPPGTLDALDWRGLWRITDALLACSTIGRWCDSLYGPDPGIAAMGTWSDGHPARTALGAPEPPAAPWYRVAVPRVRVP